MAPVIYESSVTILRRALQRQIALLKMGEKWCDEKGHPHSELLEGTLAADMKPLTFQVQSCCNNAAKLMVRIEVLEVAPIPDEEKSFAELYARIEKTIGILDSAKPEAFEGKEGMDIDFKLGPHDWKFTGYSILQKFALPNFFFHHAMVYAILRSKGVPVGKMDYLGQDVGEK